jgi:hypothetical protein
VGDDGRECPSATASGPGQRITNDWLGGIDRRLADKNRAVNAGSHSSGDDGTRGAEWHNPHIVGVGSADRCAD